jgi:hypothetical protein
LVNLHCVGRNSFDYNELGYCAQYNVYDCSLECCLKIFSVMKCEDDTNCVYDCFLCVINHVLIYISDQSCSVNKGCK